MPDVCIIELGGTVGDIESHSFVESMRQLRMKAGSEENFVSDAMYLSTAISDNRKFHIHVTYVPVNHGEQKTKFTQQAIRDIQSAGLFPDLIACRCEKILESSTVEKIAHRSQVLFPPLKFRFQTHMLPRLKTIKLLEYTMFHLPTMFPLS